MLFFDTANECRSVLTAGRGSTDYALTAADSAGNIAVLGRRDGQYRIVWGSQSGEYSETWKLTAPEIPTESIPTTLYIASGGAAYVGMYDTSRDEARLLLFRITEQGKSAELLLSEPCAGESLAEQTAETRLSAFAEVDSVVTFALLQGDNAQFYRRTGLSSGLEKGEQLTLPDLQTAISLADWSSLAVGGNVLYCAGQAVCEVPDGAVITDLIRVGAGVYCVDGAGLEVFYADCTEWQMLSVLRLEELADTLDHTLDIEVTRNGSVLLLTDDGGLLLDCDGTLTDLSSILAPPVWRCVLILAALAAAVLILTTVVWFLLCRQRRLPLPVRWGTIAALSAIAALGLVRCFWLLPAAELEAQQETMGLVDSIISLSAKEKSGMDDASVERIGNALSASLDGCATVSVYEREGGVWYLAASDTGAFCGIRGEMCRYFDESLAQQAADGESAWGVLQQGGQTLFVRCYAENGRLLVITADGSRISSRSYEAERWIERAMAALAFMLTAIVWLCLCAVYSQIHSISGAMERLAGGEQQVIPHLGSGDELAGLADSLTALSKAMDGQRRQHDILVDSYRRFVPERILSLLGKASVTEVDKQTVVSRDMVAMTVQFQFPPQVYEASGRELFDNINEIMERTAPIVARSGGAVFNFAYNGYDAVFENGGAAAVSAAVAVQQEVLELNRSREMTGAPPVTMQIALDEGNVMIGIVGDGERMEPTSVSSSFSVLKHLVRLCGNLQAGILCTQSVMTDARGYATRYMGKCREGNSLLRVYEIFDGDRYDVRKLKEQTGGKFSEGVYALYSRDFQKAKGIFLNLVHRNTGDGGARWYLYLTDLLEKQDECEISLDA